MSKANKDLTDWAFDVKLASMQGPDEGASTALRVADADSTGIVLTTDEFSHRVRTVIESRLGDHTPGMAPIFAALFNDNIRRVVAEVITDDVRRFESEQDVVTIVEGTAINVAEAVRAQMDVFTDIALTGYRFADGIYNPADRSLSKTRNSSLTKLAIRAHQFGNFSLEAKLRRILKSREGFEPGERLVNLQHLQDTLETLGELEECIAVNMEILEYLEALMKSGMDEKDLKGNSFEVAAFRARHKILTTKRNLGKHDESEEIAYYEKTIKECRDCDVLCISLRRLVTIYQSTGDAQKVLYYSLLLTATQLKSGNTERFHRANTISDKHLRAFGIVFGRLGIDPDDDLTKLAALEIPSLRLLIEKAQGRPAVQSSIRLVIQLKEDEEMTKATEADNPAKQQAKGELLTFLEAIWEEAQHWQKAGTFKDMCLIPDNKKDEVLRRFDELITACRDSRIIGLTQFVRQNLNATSSFVKLEILSKAIGQLRTSL